MMSNSLRTEANESLRLSEETITDNYGQLMYLSKGFFFHFSNFLIKNQ